MTDKDEALKRLYKRLNAAIDAKRMPYCVRSYDGRTGYNDAITDVLDIIEQSADEMWYEEVKE